MILGGWSQRDGYRRRHKVRLRRTGVNSCPRGPSFRLGPSLSRCSAIELRAELFTASVYGGFTFRTEHSVSGDATFAGTNYQASVIAYVFVHILTETKLRWVAIADDTPSAVSAEVSGPGDDARVEFRTGSAPVEIQAKHGLKPQKCIEAFEAIRDRSTSADATGVLLVIDSTSSSSIRNDLWRDLERLRSGRSDGLIELTRNILSAVGPWA
jgi:hypothetical protein